MFCNKCGHRNDPEAFFCRSCGAALDRGGAPTGPTPVMATDMAHAAPDGTLEAGAGGGPLLVVRRGPSAGSSFAVSPPTMRIGRHPDSDIFLDHITVSRRHALLTVRGASVSLADVGSMNGSYVNGVLCEAERFLAHGDCVRVGVFELVYFDAGAGRPRLAPR